MSAAGSIPNAGVPSSAGSQDAARETAASDALHALAQPLTSLSFILEIARRQPDPELWHQALADGLVECRRAVAALELLRSALEATASPASASPTLQAPGDE